LGELAILQSKLARDTGISEATISRLANGHIVPTPDQMQILWEMIGIPPCEWFANPPTRHRHER
jgi:predicted transcriptional regulator